MAHSHRRGSSETPWGVLLLALLGIVGSFFGVVGSFGLILEGGLVTAVGAVVFLLGLGQFVVSAGLLTLKPWAFKGAVVTFAFDGLIDLALANLLGMLVSFLVVGYLIVRSGLFLDSGVDYK